MRAVLYTHDFEPITVIDLPMEYWNMLRRGHVIDLAVIRPFRIKDYKAEPETIYAPADTVRITSSFLVRDGVVTMMLFTEDEELALLLPPEFLPGQQRELKRRRDLV